MIPCTLLDLSKEQTRCRRIEMKIIITSAEPLLKEFDKR
jgi:hypothetical protein